MKSELKAGMKHSRRIKIEADRTISFMGEDLRVYATPEMVWDLENVCNQFLLEHLPSSKSSVGAHVSVDHLGPTLVGMNVDISVEVTEIDGRKVSFEVEVRDELDVVGKAKHVRVVVDIEKQKERLEAKAARLKLLNK